MPEITEIERPANQPTALRVGEVRRFGPDGVLYQIISVPERANDAIIRVLDTDEELSYAISKILADPAD